MVRRLRAGENLSCGREKSAVPAAMVDVIL
jgi:hypothetical protein